MELDSKMNWNRRPFKTETFLIIESTIGFDNADFTQRIKEELDFVGLDHQEFAESLYMSKDRLKTLFHKKGVYTADEIFRICKRLGFL
jgi:hypothetical protein